ncbi:precorrin-3B synthase [Mycolicibacterium madagascariense]|uniref:Precorrin-3B synthase n=1 Tax=Mycolicibacterium madagascariense TaxID=212765 RepID=A0A7I7XIK1_9MYCO|nr:precorrin-3B synthase [Mycolicibacterium madagascariense]MCV7011092.1 precorrin-3B synthase [Mycolicibacterium madagascariense]BBZ29010.1 precorrin-3B synthase [Mycolicibacterium madagascariense]
MTRTRDDDACPGALQVHQAADGALARIRLPGGMIAAPQLEALALAAARFGSSSMELTSRGNVQVRGVTDATGLAEAVAAAGLLPSPSHERVRNVVASPLSGRVGGLADTRGGVRDLDAAIQASDRLAELPGRFLFALDDGRGDVSGLGADVGAHYLDEDTAALLVAGVDTGIRTRDVVPALVELAERFVDVRGTAWRTTELDDPTVLLAGWTPTAEPGAGWPPTTRPPVGWLTQDDGRVTLGAAVPLGVLRTRVAEYLAAVGSPLVITPWRSVLVCDLDEGIADTALRVLAPLGLVFDEASPWLDVSACTGSPGCAHSAADVRRDAADAARAGGAGGAGDGRGHRHFVGCERACGSPPTGEVLVATDGGYEVREQAS